MNLIVDNNFKIFLSAFLSVNSQIELDFDVRNMKSSFSPLLLFLPNSARSSPSPHPLRPSPPSSLFISFLILHLPLLRLSLSSAAPSPPLRLLLLLSASFSSSSASFSPSSSSSSSAHVFLISYYISQSNLCWHANVECWTVVVQISRITRCL